VAAMTARDEGRQDGGCWQRRGWGRAAIGGCSRRNTRGTAAAGGCSRRTYWAERWMAGLTAAFVPSAATEVISPHGLTTAQRPRHRHTRDA
jgi:hypothetical protein